MVPAGVWRAFADLSGTMTERGTRLAQRATEAGFLHVTTTKVSGSCAKDEATSAGLGIGGNTACAIRFLVP